MMLSAHQAAAEIRRGTLTSEALVRDCLAQIEQREAEVQAWTFLDPDYALSQARAADARQKAGLPLGPLHGVPVGLKDVIDTADMPTENGTPLHAGRMAQRDARLVELLRDAGAVIMGKTVTTELATYSPGKTRNPHNPAHTPGGSSSGSAAAVAAGMVPLALGTQTNGSMIRPAAFCGIFGFKPSRGLLPLRGILRQSPAFDQAGFFARDIADLALLGETLAARDPADAATPRARPPLRQVCAAEPPAPPRLAFLKTPLWPQAETEVHNGFATLLGQLGEHVAEVAFPDAATPVLDWHKTVMEAEIAANYAAEYQRGAARLSVSLRSQIERGRAVTAVDYLAALEKIPLITAAIDRLFENCDAILTPAAAGAAPLGLESTGSPMFCTLWTFCGMPALSLPLLRAANGLPIGAQLVGRVGDDARLLRTARWLCAQTMTA